MSSFLLDTSKLLIFRDIRKLLCFFLLDNFTHTYNFRNLSKYVMTFDLTVKNTAERLAEQQMASK